MYLELTTGRDTFRAQGRSQRRITSVATFVRVDTDGEGREIVPLFAAYQKRLKNFKETQLIDTMPATSEFAPGLAGNWYRNRHEVLPGTEILIEYRRNALTGFGELTEYLMIVADPNAALYQVRIDFPPHHLSSMPAAFFTGRFEVVSSDAALPEAGCKAWKDFMSIDGNEYEVSDLLDPNQEQRFFHVTELEPAVRKERKATIVQDAKGHKRLQIRRVRRIKTTR